MSKIVLLFSLILILGALSLVGCSTPSPTSTSCAPSVSQDGLRNAQTRISDVILETGVTLRVLRAGDPKNPPLLLLHGGFLSHKAWVHQVPHFAKNWHVIAPDLRGHGASSKPLYAYAARLWAEDVEALCKELGLKTVTVMGHSLGGIVAQQLAHDHPDRLDKLILVDTTYSTSSNIFEAMQTKMAKITFEVMSIKDLAHISGYELGKTCPQSGIYARDEMLKFKKYESQFMHMWHAIFNFDSRAWLHTIKTPTLILVASKNKPTHDQAKAMVKLLPNAQLKIIPKAGHMLNWDNPEHFHATVDAFLHTPERPALLPQKNNNSPQIP